MQIRADELVAGDSHFHVQKIISRCGSEGFFELANEIFFGESGRLCHLLDG